MKQYGIGDQIIMPDNNERGKVIRVHGDKSLSIQLNNGSNVWLNTSLLQGNDKQLDEVEIVDDPSKAFLTELKALLEKYRASIRDYESNCVFIDIGDVTLSYNMSRAPYCISADNVFNYELI